MASPPNVTNGAHLPGVHIECHGRSSVQSVVLREPGVPLTDLLHVKLEAVIGLPRRRKARNARHRRRLCVKQLKQWGYAFNE